MPKLIDVEKLEKYKADCCVSLTQWQEGWNDAIDMIMNETPTVEAIPVEWVLKWHEGSPFSDIEVIRLLLADWENENNLLREK